jgi:biotin operon repressor
MESRHQKRLRTLAIDPGQNTISLQQLVHVGGISNAALVKVVKQLRKTPDVVVSSRRLDEADLASFM